MYSHVIRPSKLPILLENPESPKYNWDGKNPDLTLILFWYFKMNSYDTDTRTPNRVYLTKVDAQKIKKKHEI